jgi:hypothetical protein
LDAEGRFVVIELKVSHGYDRSIGQILRYMAWIKKHHAEPAQDVRGIIAAREISEDLVLACSYSPNVSLYEYQSSVALKKSCRRDHRQDVNLDFPANLQLVSRESLPTNTHGGKGRQTSVVPGQFRALALLK